MAFSKFRLGKPVSAAKGAATIGQILLDKPEPPAPASAPAPATVPAPAPAPITGKRAAPEEGPLSAAPPVDSGKRRYTVAPSPFSEERLVVAPVGDGTWFWESDDKQWRPFETDTDQRVELAFKAGRSVIEWERGGFVYYIYVDAMVQRNLRTNKRRAVKRVIALDLARGVAADRSFEVSRAPSLYRTPFKLTYPSEWDIPLFGAEAGLASAEETHNCTLVLLDEENHASELARVTALVMARGGVSVGEVVAVARVQNLALWNRFALARFLMAHKNAGTINQLSLFHGTRAVPPCRIYDSEEGFDPRFCSSGKWGIGSYFTSDLPYAAAFGFSDPAAPPGTVDVFLSRVLTGHAHAALDGNASLRLPPAKTGLFATSLLHRARRSSAADRYDSVVGVSGTSTIFTIYSSAQAYPAYLVRLKKTAPPQ